MRQKDLKRFQGEVATLAQKAGRAILDIYESPECVAGGIGVREKSDRSPVTTADLVAHELIRDGLQRLTPDVKCVSEEDDGSLNHRTCAGTFWLVDPLDGTREFLARTGEFTVNIALVQDGTAVWGVVVAPALGLTYSGGHGLGALLQTSGNTLPIQVCQVPAGARRRVIASRSHLTPETTEFISRLGAVDLVPAGSSLKFCRIAEGAADVYPRLGPTCEWDTAAAQAVLEGAGGYVYDTGGARLRYGKPEVLNPHFIAASAPLSSLFPA